MGIHIHFFQLPPCKTSVRSFDTKLVANISHQLTSHLKKNQPGTGGPSGPAPLIDSYFHWNSIFSMIKNNYGEEWKKLNDLIGFCEVLVDSLSPTSNVISWWKSSLVLLSILVKTWQLLNITQYLIQSLLFKKINQKSYLHTTVCLPKLSVPESCEKRKEYYTTHTTIGHLWTIGTTI